MVYRAAHRGSQPHFFYALLRQLADKARRAVINLFPVQTAGFRIGQRQLLHGARYADVGQATLLLQAAAFIKGHLAREHPFFDADDEHLRELQPFRRVQGHQLNRVLPGVRLPLARFQRGVGEERLQRHQIFIFFVVAELARRRHQLL